MLQGGDAGEAEGGQHHRPLSQVPQGEEGGVAGRHDPGAAQADDGEEVPDPGGDRHLLRAGDAVDHPLAQGEDGEDEHQEAGAEHGPEPHLPGQAQGAHGDGREVGVEPHPRGQGDRIVGVEPHDRAPEGGGETGSHQHRPGVHAGAGQHPGVHEDDVGDGEEGGAPCQHLGAHARAPLLQPETARQPGHHSQGPGPGRRTIPAIVPLVAATARGPRCRTRIRLRRVQEGAARAETSTRKSSFARPPTTSSVAGG